MHALRVLAVLSEGDGRAGYRLAQIAARSGVDQSTVSHVVGRLAAAGWARAVPGGNGTGSAARAFRLTSGGRAGARGALDAARAGVAAARKALRPGGDPVPVPLSGPVAGPGISAALLIRAFLGTPGKPCGYGELSARTGMSWSAVTRLVALMEVEGWVARFPAPGAAGKRAPARLALTPAGLAAAPAVLDAARRRLESIARDLGAGQREPERLPAGPRRAGRGRRPGVPLSCRWRLEASCSGALPTFPGSAGGYAWCP